MLAALLMGFTLLLTAEATIATTDAVLLAAVLGAQGVLLRLYRAARGRRPRSPNRMVMWGWAALAIGILVKGPVAAGVTGGHHRRAAGLGLVGHRPRKAAVPAGRDAEQKPRHLPPRRRWQAAPSRIRTGTVWKTILWLRTSPWGVPLMLLIVAPWLIAIGIQSHGAFFQQSLGNDFAAKLAGGQESHGAPPGYNLAAVGASPSGPRFCSCCRRIGLGRGAARKEPAIRFLLAWAGGLVAGV